MTDSTDEAFEALVREIARTPAVPSIPHHVAPGMRLGGRFDLESKLGAGGMGQVFAAFDRTWEARVALKILRSLPRGSNDRLKREFRAASEIVHPNLVRLHELFLGESECFFTMDLVEGSALPDLLRVSSGATTDFVRLVFQELATALHALHQCGTVHGDLKPSNFLITARDKRVVLLDFGLARPIGAAQEREVAGTPTYMAPEQGLSDTVSAAADWYAFGVVLYEALTGVLPLRRPSEERLRGAPADLKGLCLELLRLRAEDRPSGDEILRALGLRAASAPPSSLPAPKSRRDIFGREDELAQLREGFARSCAGAPTLAMLHGPSGIGKTALVEQFVATVASEGALVLKGRCRERESMPYKAVDALIDDVVGVLRGLGSKEADALVPKDVADLAILFPALGTVPHVSHAPHRVLATSDHLILRQSAIAAFRALLLGFRGRAPIVIWIDDLQWSDAESALLLGPLLSGPEAVPLFFIGSYRSPMDGRGPLLESMLAGGAARSRARSI